MRSTWPLAAQVCRASIRPNSTSRIHLRMMNLEQMWLRIEGRWSSKTSVMNVHASDASSQYTPLNQHHCFFFTYKHLKDQRMSKLPQPHIISQLVRTLSLFIPRTIILPWPRIARHSPPLVPAGVIPRCFSELGGTRQVSFRKLSRQLWSGPATRTAMHVLEASPAALAPGKHSAAYDVCGSMRALDASQTRTNFLSSDLRC